ncbi:hypothetical protein HHI36_002123 [Cryptolaemus montrouzieri]|uniref:Uncharacterized protein n=1 Tax=Cryptolaemus montrouzieri TaxID=559131 RepID=A0ABD2P9M1_9CUCU
MEVVDDINLLELEIDSNFEPNYQCIECADELHCHILDAAKQLTNKNRSTSSPPALSPSTSSTKVELPKMELVDFSGDPETGDLPSQFIANSRKRLVGPDWLKEPPKIGYWST